jgi:acyl-CoA dehydrogenase
MLPIEEDHQEIRRAVEAICKDFPGAYWRKLEEERKYPQEFVDVLTRAGYLGALIPEEYGGSGYPIRAAAVILETIHASGCNAGACHAQMYMMGTILKHGSDEQKQRYLPDIASGKLRLQAFAVTEPTTGSDTTKLRTRAVKEGDHYSIHGQKIWTSRALQSDLMLVLARTTPVDQVKRRTEGLSVFLLDIRDNVGKGLDIRPIDTMVNHLTNEVFFTGAKVPAQNLIGQEGQGFKYILDGMNVERMLVAAECIGDARFFIKKAAEYVSGREVFGRPIGQNQAVQFPIARAYAETRAADLVNRTGTALFDAGKPCGEEANIAKLLASEASWHAAEACLQAHGGFGFAREYDVERKWRETRLYQVAPISTNLIYSYVAEHLLGLPRSF